jgi:hypothetical protein
MTGMNKNANVGSSPVTPVLGLGISDTKIIPRKTEETEQMIISDGIPAVPRNRNLSEFRSEPFRGRENNSEFCSVEQTRGRETTRNPFRVEQNAAGYKKAGLGESE